jgi:hypothetical protein
MWILTYVEVSLLLGEARGKEQMQSHIFTCLFWYRSKPCTQASQAISELTPEKNRRKRETDEKTGPIA